MVLTKVRRVLRRAVGRGYSNTAERKFEQLLEFAPDGIVGVDNLGKIVIVNRQAEHMFGYAQHELVGQPVEQLVPERFRDGHERHRLGYAKDPYTRPMGAELSLFGRRKDGSEFPAEISLSNIQTETGALTMTAIRDVTERLRAEAEAQDEHHRREIVAAMLAAEEAERSRIAAALHDDTVQVLTASLVTLDRVALAARKHGDTETQALIATARATVEEATERTRRLTFQLRPVVLHERGLAHALRAVVEQTGREIGAETSVSAPNERFDKSMEELVYRTVQEAVLNIRKHSHASHIRVTVDRLPSRLAGVVADNGRGFDVEAATGPSSDILHMGMHAMIERVRMAGGSINVDSRRGEGTRISFQVPLCRTG